MLAAWLESSRGRPLWLARSTTTTTATGQIYKAKLMSSLSCSPYLTGEKLSPSEARSKRRVASLWANSNCFPPPELVSLNWSRKGRPHLHSRGRRWPSVAVGGGGGRRPRGTLIKIKARRSGQINQTDGAAAASRGGRVAARILAAPSRGRAKFISRFKSHYIILKWSARRVFRPARIVFAAPTVGSGELR